MSDNQIEQVPELTYEQKLEAYGVALDAWEKAGSPEGSKPSKPRKSLPELDLSTFSTAEIVSSKVTGQRRNERTARDRKPAQKAIDQIAQKAHEAWVKAGKPAAWADRPSAHLVVPEGQLASLRAAVYSACQFLGKRVRFGDIVVKNGKADVIFTVTDRPAGSTETNETNS